MWDSYARLQNSVHIVYTAYKYILLHKQLYLYPVIATLIMAPAALAVFLFGVNHAQQFPMFRMIFLLLVLYFINSIIDAFITVAAARSILNTIENKPVFIIDSLKNTLYKLPIIIEWAVLFRLLHYNLGALTMPHQHDLTDSVDSKPQKIIRIVESVAEFAWELTVFLVPVLIAVEQIPLRRILNHSIAYLKNSFGAQIIEKFSFYTLNLLLILCSSVFLILTISYMRHNYWIGFYATIGSIIGLIFMMNLISLTQIIFKTAVYAYTKNKQTVLLNPSFIKHNFVGELN
jgi:hypothetical protein